jgi:hypothetical protein
MASTIAQNRITNFTLIYAGLPQQLRCFFAVGLKSDAERGSAVIRCRVDVGALLDQKLQDGGFRLSTVP